MNTAVALRNEVRKGLRFAWSERLQILIELPMFAILIILLGPLLGQGKQLAAGTVDWSLNSGTISAGSPIRPSRWALIHNTLRLAWPTRISFIASTAR